MSMKARRDRIDRVVKMLKSAQKQGEDFVDSVKFISLCSYNIGVSTEKIIEYLSMLGGLGVCRIDFKEKRIYFEEFKE